MFQSYIFPFSMRTLSLYICGSGVLGLMLLLVGCGAPPIEEGCDAPIPSTNTPGDSSHDSLSDAFGVAHGAMVCGPGTASEPCQSNTTSPVDGYAGYQGQTSCSPSAKPGVVSFRDLILRTFPCSGDFGIVRECSSGGQSEHKEGRAWDWKVYASNQGAVAQALINWLLATRNGVAHANARRLGIMYMIWNRKMWRAYRPNDGWTAYTGSNPHTDHIHFSFSWAGANKQTSFWKGSCGAKCEVKCLDGNTLQTSDCQKINCGAVGHRCSAVGGPPRCISVFCPASGTKNVCLNDDMGVCNNGKLEVVKCSAFGLRCTTEGGTRCISVFCPASGKKNVCIKDDMGVCNNGKLELIKCSSVGYKCSTEGGVHCHSVFCPPTGKKNVCIKQDVGICDEGKLTLQKCPATAPCKASPAPACVDPSQPQTAVPPTQNEPPPAPPKEDPPTPEPTPEPVPDPSAPTEPTTPNTPDPNHDPDGTLPPMDPDPAQQNPNNDPSSSPTPNDPNGITRLDGQQPSSPSSPSRPNPRGMGCEIQTHSSIPPFYALFLLLLPLCLRKRRS